MNRPTTCSNVTFIFMLLRVFPLRVFASKCGDCWCIPDSNATCPKFEAGYYDSLPAIYKTFLLVQNDENPYPKLHASDGSGSCFPFPDLASNSKLSNLPQVKWNPCTPESEANNAQAVCAFIYNDSISELGLPSCTGRKYGLQTFPSSDDAVAAGAVVTHTSACGVCSSAQDLFVMSQPDLNVDLVSKNCGVTYVIQVSSNNPQAFDNLINCLATKVGYSYECSKLWAHSIAVTSQLCPNQCSKNEPYNGAAPTCEFNDCLKCKDSTVEARYRLFAGRIPLRSGLTQRITYNCSEFSKVIQEPCDGNFSDYPNLPSPSQPPSKAPTKSEKSPAFSSLAGTAVAFYLPSAFAALYLINYS